VYFGTSSTPGPYKAGIATSSLALPRLSAGARYYWRVVANNQSGSTSGPTWSFVVRSGKR